MHKTTGPRLQVQKSTFSSGHRASTALRGFNKVSCRVTWPDQISLNFLTVAMRGSWFPEINGLQSDNWHTLSQSDNWHTFGSDITTDWRWYFDHSTRTPTQLCRRTVTNMYQPEFHFLKRRRYLWNWVNPIVCLQIHWKTSIFRLPASHYWCTRRTMMTSGSQPGSPLSEFEAKISPLRL